MTPPTVQFIPASLTGYLQEITWTMTGSSTANVSSSGQEIIHATRGAGLSWAAGKPRFWNGSEALNSGATESSGLYVFSTAAVCRAWWDNYQIDMEKNGGGFVSIGDPVNGAAQTIYLNANSLSIPGAGTDFVSGDVVKFRVSTAS